MAVESIKEEGPGSRVVMVSCDLLNISDCIRGGVREILSRRLPGMEPESVFFGATHTHAGPRTLTRTRYVEDAEPSEPPHVIESGAMPVSEYVAFASERIAGAVIDAWQARKPSGIAYGLGHAVAGRNRIMAYKDGSSVMYGLTDVPEFSHVEGYEDHSVGILSTHLPDGKLTGVIVNIACPSQTFMGHHLSADFWHETRKELRNRLGEDIFILAQLSAAGDQDSRAPVESRAEQRMGRLAGLSRREVIAKRIADTVEEVIPLIAEEISWHPELRHHHEVIELQRIKISDEMVAEAFKESEGRGRTLKQRMEYERQGKKLPVEVHAVRLGEVGFVTNPFELYLDYGMRIKGRSPAMQTFIVQLAGPGSYLPTGRALGGKAYGAIPRSNVVGVEGGDHLVNWSVQALQNFWVSKHEVPRADSIPRIDGDISKWRDVPGISFGSSEPGRFGAKLYAAWDDKAFYMAVEVSDKKHFNTRQGSGIWDGDCLQFALRPGPEEDAFNLGLALASGRVQAHQWRGPETGLFQKSEYTVVRDEENLKTYYEARIPFTCLGIHPEQGKSFGFSAVVFNDEDGTGHSEWIELSRGIAGGWNPARFPEFTLAN